MDRVRAEIGFIMLHTTREKWVTHKILGASRKIYNRYLVPFMSGQVGNRYNGCVQQNI